MAKVIALSIFLFLMGCTIYQSPERRQFETDSSTFAAVENSKAAAKNSKALTIYLNLQKKSNPIDSVKRQP